MWGGGGITICSVHNQVQVYGRNYTNSNSVPSSSFAIKIGSNFIIGLEIALIKNLFNQLEAFSFQFCGQRSSVTIHAIC